MNYLLLSSLCIILLQNSTKQHYITPPHNCVLAMICNHTGISLCGIDKDRVHKRMFLDECDMFEYNCDHHKAYLKIDQSECTSKETASVATSKITTKEILTSLTTESINLTTQSTATINLSTPTLPLASEAPTTIIITRNTSPSRQTSLTTESINLTTQSTATVNLSTPTITLASEPPTTIIITSIPSPSRQTKMENITKITASTLINATTIGTELTTTPISTVFIDSNCTRSKGNKSSDLKITKAITKNLTKPMSTILSTQSLTPDSSPLKTDATILLTTEVISTLSNSTKSDPNLSTSGANTSDAITTITTEYKEINENTIAGNGEDVTSSTQDVCKTYPNYCDRPRTWETTVKGETRDFFQILKARFGTRVRLLRDTTHFPQHLNISINDFRISLNEDNESFHYGAHNEG